MRKYKLCLYIWILFFVAAIPNLVAQEINITSFKHIDNDLDARVNFPKLDQNGEKCALIKFVTTQSGFSFDVGSLGIVATEQKAGEIWVYVPRGIQRITISHPQLGILRNYILPIAIEKANVYEAILVSAKVETIVKEDINVYYIVINSVPEGANVFVNDEYLGKTPFSRLFKNGTYKYKLELDKYYTHEGSIEISGKKKEENINLKPNFGNIQITSAPEDGMAIFLNGVNTGKKTPAFIEEIKSGEYEIKLIGEWYKPHIQKIIIEDNKASNLKIEMLPNYGTIKLSVKPESSKVYIDNLLQNNTLINKRMIGGFYTIKVEAENYYGYNRNIEIEIGKETKLNIDLKGKTGTLDVNVQPFGAEIYLDKVYVGKSPELVQNILIGNYNLEIKKEGFAKYQTQIDVKENETINIQKELQKISKGSVFINSNPEGASIYLNRKYIGKTPSKIESIDEGEYTLKLTKDGFISAEKMIIVLPQKETRINETLAIKSSSKKTKNTYANDYGIIIYSGAALVKTGIKSGELNMPINLFIEKYFLSDKYALRLNSFYLFKRYEPMSNDVKSIPIINKKVSIHNIITASDVDSKIIQKDVLASYNSIGADFKINLIRENFCTFYGPSFSHRFIRITDNMDKIISIDNNNNFEVHNNTKNYNFDFATLGVRAGQLANIYGRMKLSYDAGLHYNFFTKKVDFDMNVLLGYKF